MSSSLTAGQEAEAQALAAQLREATSDDILELARLLVSKPEQQIFGTTEFEVRDLVHRIGAKAFEAQLARKKTATSAPGSSVPAVGKAPASTGTGRKRR